MRSIGVGLFLLGTLCCAHQAAAQCQGGGGMATGTGTASATAGTGSVRMLTGPGSFAYDAMLAQAMQRQISARQIALAAQKQAERAADLAQRQEWASQKRQQIADRRERMRTFIAGQAQGQTAALQVVFR